MKLRELRRQPSGFLFLLTLNRYFTESLSTLINLTVLFCIFSGVITPLPAAQVQPGTVHTYEWTVPERAGPVKGDADCLTYLYYSGVDPVKDTSSGLVGPLLVCRQRSLSRGQQVGKTGRVSILCIFIFNYNSDVLLGLPGVWKGTKKSHITAFLITAFKKRASKRSYGLGLRRNSMTG